MTPADLQILERESAPVVDDPAVVAGREAQEAAAAWSAYAKAHPTLADEQTPEYKTIKERSEKADQDFSDAPVTSLAGALTKLRALAKDITEDRGPEGWDLGHVKTVTAYLDGVECMPSVVGDDHPDAELLALWEEWNRLTDQINNASDMSDDESNALGGQASRIEVQMCDTIPHTPAGLVVLVKLLAGFQEGDPTFADERDKTLSRNILAALERLTPGLAEIGWGLVATPDPAVVTAREAKEAAAAFNAMTGDEPGPEFDAVQARSEKADAAFADAPVTSAAGALAKMEELRATVMSPTIDPDETYLDARHFKTVVAFLEGRVVAAEPDPAVAALAEYRKAKAADDAISTEDAEAETLEYQATGDRVYAAQDAVYDAVPTSLAGVGAKVRFILDHGERGNDLWVPFDTMAKSMLPFLEGGAAAGPDPVVALFAEWGKIRDEATALSAADPKATDPEINERWESAIGRCDAVEDQIMATPATTMRGVAIKIRLASHYIIVAGDVDKRYATPARDIDYVEVNGGPLDADESYVISALRDAERLAGVS